jgi:hypothetical protein
MKKLNCSVKIKQKGQKIFVFIKKETEEFSLFFIKNIKEKGLLKLSSKTQKFIDWAKDFSEDFIKRFRYALYQYILKNHTENNFVFEFAYAN